MAEGQQLLQHDRHLHAVRRALRIELQRMAADRQRLLMRRPATGRLMLAKRPPLALSQVQTFGGV
jgi:hypothetical protein